MDNLFAGIGPSPDEKGHRTVTLSAPDAFDGVSQAACRGGSLAVESLAAFAWNGWQTSSGISGNLGLEYAISRLRKKGGIKARELEAIASGIGRKRKDEKGKEPRWEHPEYGRDLRPLTIPNHSGDLKRFTARNILDQLESDLDWLEEAGKIR